MWLPDRKEMLDARTQYKIACEYLRLRVRRHWTLKYIEGILRGIGVKSSVYKAARLSLDI